jgi:hypothetical protein
MDAAVDPVANYLNANAAARKTTKAELEGALNKANAERSVAIKEIVGAIKVAAAQKKHASSWKETAKHW